MVNYKASNKLNSFFLTRSRQYFTLIVSILIVMCDVVCEAEDVSKVASILQEYYPIDIHEHPFFIHAVSLLG